MLFPVMQIPSKKKYCSWNWYSNIPSEDTHNDLFGFQSTLLGIQNKFTEMIVLITCDIHITTSCKWKSIYTGIFSKVLLYYSMLSTDISNTTENNVCKIILSVILKRTHA